MGRFKNYHYYLSSQKIILSVTLHRIVNRLRLGKTPCEGKKALKNVLEIIKYHNIYCFTAKFSVISNKQIVAVH